MPRRASVKSRVRTYPLALRRQGKRRRMVFLRLVSARGGGMHQAMTNVRHFIQSVRIMLRTLAIAGWGAGRWMALAAMVVAGCPASAAAQAPKLPAGFV